MDTRKLQQIKILLTIIACCLLVVPHSQADNFNWRDDDKLKISIGTFITDYDSDFRLSSSALGLGTSLSFEDDLGLEESKANSPESFVSLVGAVNPPPGPAAWSRCRTSAGCTTATAGRAELPAAVAASREPAVGGTLGPVPNPRRPA